MQYGPVGPGRSLPAPVVPQNPPAFVHVNGSTTQPTPIKSVDSELASLPAFDSRTYYDSDIEEDEDWSERFQGCTNRGRKHKLGSRAAHIGKMPGWSRVMPTTFEESERAAKRQKRNTLHPHLTFTPGDHQLGNNASVGGNDDHPAIAQIEAPPTNPVQVLSRLANIRTFCTSTHSSVFSNLALNAIGLIETDHDCVKALNRTCAILRGDDLSWLPPEKTDPLPVSRFPPTDDDETEQRPSSSTSAQAAAQANPAPAQESPSKVEAEEPDILLSNSANHSSSLQDAQPEAGPSSNGPHLPNGSGPSKRESSPSALERSLQLQKLIDPATAVESLFVSPTPVAVPSSGSTAIVSLNEQKLLLHAGLIELSRFLADCLEYQARLREISDLVHGVDRRRKGLYTIIKRFANEYEARPPM